MNETDDPVAECLQQIAAVLEPFVTAIASAWDAIMAIAADVVARVIQWYCQEVRPVLLRLGLVDPISHSSMARRKMRRVAALMRAR